MYLCKICFRKEIYCRCLWTEYIDTDKLFNNENKIKKKFRKLYIKYKIFNLNSNQ